jgi:hypothetical protein
MINTAISICIAASQTLPVLRNAIPKGIILGTDLMTGGPVADCIFSQIQQVVINLVTNAIEAIGEQTGKITPATKTAPSRNVAKSHSAPADWQPKTDTLACLEVTDTGCGMPAEDLDRLFDPFFTTKFIGRGLGLPVVFGIVKAFDGVISVESRQGRGSTFRIYLPLVMDAHAAAPEGAARSRGGKTGGTVLPVDDQEAVCRVAERMPAMIIVSAMCIQNSVCPELSKGQAPCSCFDTSARTVMVWPKQ